MEIKTEKSNNYKNLILKKPNWLVRFGSGLMFFLLLLILLLSHFIEYPEYIEADINIVSEDHIKRLVSKRGGNLHLITKNGEFVTKGQELAYIENSSIEILKLRKIIDSISNDLTLIESKEFVLDSQIILGELEPFYIDFLKKRNDFFIFNEISSKENNKKNLGRTLILNRQVKNEILKEKQILEKELFVEKEKLNRVKKLYLEGIVSKNDFNKAEQDFLEREKQIQNSKTSISQANVSEMEIKNNIDNLDYQISEDELKYRQEMESAFNRLKAEISNWSYEFSFNSPIDGKIFFNNNWSNNEFISENQEFGAIIPINDTEIYCMGVMKSNNSGKVVKGQKVKIYLDSFNYEENGILRGEVFEVYPIPEKNQNGEYQYKLRIKLKEGLKTSLNKTIPYTPNLNGNAKIITKDLSLLERVFLKIIKLIEN